MSQAAVRLAILPLYLVWIWPPLLIYIIFFTKYNFVGLAYLAWIYFDWNTCSTGGRRYDFVRNSVIFKDFAQHVSAQLIKTVDLDSSRNYLMCSHPHGVFAHGATLSSSSEATGISRLFPGIKTFMLGVDGHFWVPIWRELFTIYGVVSSSSKSLNYLLSEKKGGNAPVLCVGGVHEVLDAHPNKDYVIHIMRRRKFIEIALKNGSPIVPMFTFGENELYEQFSNPKGSWLRRMQDFLLKKTGIPFVALKTHLPLSHPITTVVGAPIVFEKLLEPTAQDVDIVHSLYVESLKDLFETHKHKYGEGQRKLIIC